MRVLFLVAFTATVIFIGEISLLLVKYDPMEKPSKPNQTKSC